jgi:hypothetical protein
VKLLSFTAQAHAERIEIRWEFTDAVEHSGFNLHRSFAGEGDYLRVNPHLITETTSPIVYEDRQVEPGRRYEYRLEALARDGSREWFGPIIAETGALGARERLAQNVPNPFKPSTAIQVNVPAPGPVNVLIYSAQGRLVRVLSSSNASAGPTWLTWDGTDFDGRALPSGTYFYRLPGGSEALRMTLVR